MPDEQVSVEPETPVEQSNEPIRFDRQGQPINPPSDLNDLPTDVVNEPVEDVVSDDQSAPEDTATTEPVETFSKEDVERIREEARAEARAEAERLLAERQMVQGSKATFEAEMNSDPIVQDLVQRYQEAKELGDNEAMQAINEKYLSYEQKMKSLFDLRAKDQLALRDTIVSSQSALDIFAAKIGISPNEFYKADAEMNPRVSAVLDRLRKQGKFDWVKSGEYEYPRLTGGEDVLENAWKEFGFGGVKVAPAKPEPPNPNSVHTPSPETAAGSDRATETSKAVIREAWQARDSHLKFERLSPRDQFRSYRDFKEFEKELKETGYTPPVIPAHIKSFEKRLPKNKS